MAQDPDGEVEEGTGEEEKEPVQPAEIVEPDEPIEVIPPEELEDAVQPEPININIITNNDLGTKDFIDIYVINRNHIREQSKSVIPACGFLLTGAFGLLYFIFSGNSDRIPTHPLIIIFLALAAIALAASIITSIKSVQAASSSGELPETRDEQWDITKEVYDKEYEWGKWSIRLLESAIGIFIIIILYFSYEYLVNSVPTNNIPSSSIPNIIIIPMPRSF